MAMTSMCRCISHFELLNNACISHGISIMLKECLCLMFKDVTSYTLAMNYRSILERMLKSVRKSVLHTANKFLKRVEKASVGSRIQFNFRKSDKTDSEAVFTKVAL